MNKEEFEKIMGEKKPVYIGTQKNENCQLFLGPITGSVFAMPGSTVNQIASSPSAKSPLPLEESTVSDKFAYIISDNQEVIKEIEETMELYVLSNKPTELVCYLRNNVGTKFKTLPVHADTVFDYLCKRWPDKNKITKDGIRKAWQRN